MPSSRREPVRLGHPYSGVRGLVRAVRVVGSFHWRVARRAWADTWPWAHRQGLIVGALAGVLVAVADGVGEQHVHVAHLIVAGLAGFGGLMAIVLLGHLVVAPVRLYEEAREPRQMPAGLSAQGREPTFIFQEGSNPVFNFGEGEGPTAKRKEDDPGDRGS